MSKVRQRSKLESVPPFKLQIMAQMTDMISKANFFVY